MNRRIRVLVVDDSAFARKVVRESLERDPDIEVVATARDGLEALEKIAEHKPDVVTLDLVMPNLDGLGVLRTLPLGGGSPRVVVVSVADEESALGVAALRAGATDVVHKPTALATATLYELADELVAKVKIAAGARLSTAIPEVAEVVAAATRSSTRRLLLVGASTGGPQAVTRLLRNLPVGFPVPIAVVLHMPAGYTAAYAHRLDEECALHVVEADERLVLAPGTAVIARAGMHLRVDTSGGALVARLGLEPASTPHRPSVDVLFESAVGFARDVIAVVLTGMGDDGMVGARKLHGGGAAVLTEAESSCVVYGMPRSVKEAGVSTAEAPIAEMAELVGKYL
jgi:two-component system, chemotaxis family, protein-glutamate methylesterase/glutaminase